MLRNLFKRKLKKDGTPYKRATVPDMPEDPKELARALFANDRKRPAKAAKPR